MTRERVSNYNIIHHILMLDAIGGSNGTYTGELLVVCRDAIAPWWR
jgi:hypothetical protein